MYIIYYFIYYIILYFILYNIFYSILYYYFIYYIIYIRLRTCLIYIRLRTCNSEELGSCHYLSLGASPWQIILSASFYVYTNYVQPRNNWEERVGRYRLVTLWHLNPGEVEKESWSLWGMVGAVGGGGDCWKEKGIVTRRFRIRSCHWKWLSVALRGKCL